MLLSGGVNPRWRETAGTFAQGTGHQLNEVPLADGVTAWPRDAADVGAVVVQYPNYLGCIEDVAAARTLASATSAGGRS